MNPDAKPESPDMREPFSEVPEAGSLRHPGYSLDVHQTLEKKPPRPASPSCESVNRSTVASGSCCLCFNIPLLKASWLRLPLDSITQVQLAPQGIPGFLGFRGFSSSLCEVFFGHRAESLRGFELCFGLGLSVFFEGTFVSSVLVRCILRPQHLSAAEFHF